jgi:hypothetical protein
LEELLSEVEMSRTHDLRLPQRELFYSWVVRFLKGALIQKFIRVYERRLIDTITAKDADEDAHACQAIIDRLMLLPGGDKEFALLNAIMKFHFGDIRGAKQEVKTAKREHSKEDPSPYLSSGFLHLWESNYPSALQEYMRARRYVPTNQLNIANVIRFFHGVMDANPEKKQLRFGLAFVNDWFFDRQLGAEEYRIFLRDTEAINEKGIALIREHSRLRLAEIEKNMAIELGRSEK